jgi:hypothetical protein
VTYPVATICDWKIAAWDTARLIPAVVGAGEIYWQVLHGENVSNTGDHTLWIDAEGRAANGAMPCGAVVKVRNVNLKVEDLPIKAPPELQNRPLYQHDELEFWLEDTAGHKSDHVVSLKAEIIGLPAGVNTGHLGRLFRVGLRACQVDVTPEPPIPPVVEDPTLAPGRYFGWIELTSAALNEQLFRLHRLSCADPTKTPAIVAELKALVAKYTPQP